MRIREAAGEDLDAIYMMGYETWSGGRAIADYLKTCAESAKYREGTWYVLEDGDALLCSLIVYRIGEKDFGIGSIATPGDQRRRGRASRLIEGVLALLDARGAAGVYLYSDIDPRFYERWGLRALPADKQRYPKSTCMIRCPAGRFETIAGSPGYRAPDYF